MQVKDEREARGLSEYTTLHPAKYKDLLDKYTKSQEQANQQIFQMEALLKEHRTTLAKIFQYYWCAPQRTRAAAALAHAVDPTHTLVPSPVRPVTAPPFRRCPPATTGHC